LTKKYLFRCSVSQGLIRLKELDAEEKYIQEQFETIGFEIQNRKNFTISIDLIKQTYGNFDLVFDNLNVDEKKQLLQLLIKQITYHKDKIEIALYEFPHIGLNISHPEFFDGSRKWLPRLDSNQRQSG
jgi:hypothetical protein